MLAPLQKQVSIYWNKQARSQRVVIIALALALVIILPILITWSNTPTYVAAYSGLSEADAGQIVQKLEEGGITYKLKNAGTIMVESDQVYEVRLMMAREGLPKSSTVGYELFSENTLGMTEFTQKVNYQRAMEGELERTIGSLASVESVRVHLVTPEKTLLSSDQEPASASVTVKVKPGQVIDKTQVRSITHLVASSVESLTPENVVVVDNEGNLLASGDPDALNSTASQNDTQRAAESAAADEIRRKVQNMLDHTLGPNRAIVQASVAMDWTQREITSNTFDPTPAAVRSSQKVNESYNTNGVVVGGVPGADSNLPTPIPTVSGVPDGTIYNRNEETVNYEISQVQSHEVVAPGQISRVTVSVMVDDITDPAQIENIQAAVAAAAGINAERGDQIVVSSMAFDRTFYESQTTEMEEQEQLNQYIQWGIMGAAAFVLLLLVIFFLRSMSNLRKASREAWRPIMQPVGQLALQPAAATASAMPSLQLEQPMTDQPILPMGQIPTQTAQQMAASHEALTEIASKYSQMNQEDEQRAMIINKLAEDSPATVAEIIQVWLNTDEKKNG